MSRITCMTCGAHTAVVQGQCDECRGPDKPEWLEHAKALRIEPGDTVVIRLALAVSELEARNIKLTAEQAFPGHKVVVLAHGMELGVLRKDET